MYKYLICLLFLLPACGSLDAAKFDAALMANATTVQEYVSVSDALGHLIDLAMEQNVENTKALKVLSEWKEELMRSNHKVGTVAAKLAAMVEASNWPDDVKRGMFNLFITVVQKWVEQGVTYNSNNIYQFGKVK